MDELEVQLVKIWESVLDKRGIGVRDNFWELGGHSLIALRMMRRIEKMAGKELPITTLLHVPTIEELAKLLRQSERSTAWSSLVAIQPGGSKAPFFCVHGVGGLVIGFRNLARHLGEDQPFYGLQAQGTDGKRPVLTRVEDMATHYIQEMRTVQPHGPYHLGGLSFGAWVAYEMAQQLRAQGEEVDLLAMFDAYTTHWSRRSLIIKLLRLPLSESVTFMIHKAGVYLKSAGIIMQMQLLPLTLKQVRKALHLASASYVPRPYSGKITFFRSAERSIRDSDGPQAGWGKLTAGELEIVDVPGDHNNILDEPQVGVLAQRLKARLERSRNDRRSSQMVRS